VTLDVLSGNEGMQVEMDESSTSRPPEPRAEKTRIKDLSTDVGRRLSWRRNAVVLLIFVAIFFAVLALVGTHFALQGPLNPTKLHPREAEHIFAINFTTGCGLGTEPRPLPAFQGDYHLTGQRFHPRAAYRRSVSTLRGGETLSE
jgi:hypothetical protein